MKLGGLRKGGWSAKEDALLKQCIQTYGEGKWHLVPARSGLNRCRKSCRLRWLDYLKPSINHREFQEDEVDLIIRLHKLLGNRWSLIAGRLPGRTSNQIKNYWNAHIIKKWRSSSKGIKQEQEYYSVNVIRPIARRAPKVINFGMNNNNNDIYTGSTVQLPLPPLPPWRSSSKEIKQQQEYYSVNVIRPIARRAPKMINFGMNNNYNDICTGSNVQLPSPPLPPLPLPPPLPPLPLPPPPPPPPHLNCTGIINTNNEVIDWLERLLMDDDSFDLIGEGGDTVVVSPHKATEPPQEVGISTL